MHLDLQKIAKLNLEDNDKTIEYLKEFDDTYHLNNVNGYCLYDDDEDLEQLFRDSNIKVFMDDLPIDFKRDEDGFLNGYYDESDYICTTWLIQNDKRYSIKIVAGDNGCGLVEGLDMLSVMKGGYR